MPRRLLGRRSTLGLRGGLRRFGGFLSGDRFTVRWRTKGRHENQAPDRFPRNFVSDRSMHNHLLLTSAVHGWRIAKLHSSVRTGGPSSVYLMEDSFISRCPVESRGRRTLSGPELRLKVAKYISFRWSVKTAANSCYEIRTRLGTCGLGWLRSLRKGVDGDIGRRLQAPLRARLDLCTFPSAAPGVIICRRSGAGVGWIRFHLSLKCGSRELIAALKRCATQDRGSRSAPRKPRSLTSFGMTSGVKSGLEFAGFGEAQFAFCQVEGQEFFDFGFFAVAGHG